MEAFLPIKGESGWGRSEKGAFLLEHLRSEEWLLEQTAPDEGSHGLRIRGDSIGRCTCRLLMILPLPVLACSTAGFRCLCSVIWSCRLSFNSITIFSATCFRFSQNLVLLSFLSSSCSSSSLSVSSHVDLLMPRCSSSSLSGSNWLLDLMIAL